MGGESRGFMGMGGLNSQAAQGNSMASLSDYMQHHQQAMNQQMNAQMSVQNLFMGQGLAAAAMAQSREGLTLKEKLCRPDPQKYYYSDLAAAYLPANPKPNDTIEARLPTPTLNIDKLRAEVRAWTARAA